MANEYDDEVLNRVKKAWARYKHETKASQTTGARALGINQSAFSQYLRGANAGGIPLNTDFLLKFSDLVGEDVVGGLKIKKEAAGVLTHTVRATLSGIPLENRVAVPSLSSEGGYYLLEVDYDGIQFPVGSFVVVDSKSPAREGDKVVLKKSPDEPYVFGTLMQIGSRWFIVRPVASGGEPYQLQKGDRPEPIVAFYLSHSKGKQYKDF